MTQDPSLSWQYVRWKSSKMCYFGSCKVFCLNNKNIQKVNWSSKNALFKPSNDVLECKFYLCIHTVMPGYNWQESMKHTVELRTFDWCQGGSIKRNLRYTFALHNTCSSCCTCCWWQKIAFPCNELVSFVEHDLRQKWLRKWKLFSDSCLLPAASCHGQRAPLVVVVVLYLQGEMSKIK